MREVLPDLDHVTPAWLTTVLRDQRHLASGRVAAVHLKTTRPTAASLVAHLEVQYTDDAAAAVPSQLFVKTSRPDLIAAFPFRGQKEVAFYTRIAATMADPPVVRCYNAVYAPEAQKFHLVLEDVSASHFQTGWPVPPLQPHCAQAIDCLAKLHAHWWDHVRLTQEVGARPTAASVQQFFHWAEHTLPGFLDFLGDRLSGERRTVYEQALRVAPTLTQRLIADHGLTLVHGDAHFWNFLLPHTRDTDTVRIIDWESWSVGLGTMDVAYMMPCIGIQNAERVWSRRSSDGIIPSSSPMGSLGMTGTRAGMITVSPLYAISSFRCGNGRRSCGRPSGGAIWNVPCSPLRICNVSNCSKAPGTRGKGGGAGGRRSQERNTESAPHLTNKD